MVRPGSLSIFISFIFITIPSSEAQTVVPPASENSALDQKTLDQKKEELLKIKEEISSLEHQLQAKTKKEKKTNSVLENFSKQSFLLNRVINRLMREEQKKQKQIISLQQKINSLEEEINSIQDNYAKYVVAIYKSGKNSEWADIFNSGSVQQALLRYKYLNEFSERRARNLNELYEKKEKLNSERKVLSKEIAGKEAFTKQKQNERNLLNVKLNERKRILNSIRKDRKVLADELKLKKNSESKIKEMISRLVEKADLERKKNADLTAVEEENSVGGDIKIFSESNLNSVDFSFSSLKGKLIWPVSKGNIINRFGENRNKILNTVTINYGIDIRPDSDFNVKAVSDGIVSAVEWIPGYGSVIIITHNEEFRTVYGHLSEIFVEENESVRKGAVIANIAEDIEGRLLHFEIWNSRANQDPEVWLAKK